MMFIKKEIKSPKLILTLEVELNNSSLTPQEAADRLSYLIQHNRNNKVCEFLVELLRETRSSTFEVKKLEIN